MKLMPQEIEVWYLIPALRRELAKIFISDFKKTQKEISKILGVTESAISQYIKSKRASKLKFSKQEIEEIKKAAKKIISDEKSSNEHFYKLCVKFRGCQSLCKLHRKQDDSLPKNCDLCGH